MPTTNGTPNAEREIREEYVENRPTGIELEEHPSTHSVEPWDPERIRIHTKSYSLRHVVDMIDDKDLDIAPDFQRRFVWTPRQQSRLIESLLLGIPLPSFYFNENTDGHLQVVDGVQRLTTIFRYVKQTSFRLRDIVYLTDLENQKFQDLETVFRRRLNGSQIVAHVIDPQTPYRVKFDIFQRINTGGTPLSSQEIRHCMSKHQSREFLKKLVNEESFIAATSGSLAEHVRMADREMALRFIGFRQFSLNDYEQHSGFDEFLGYVTEWIDDHTSHDLNRLRVDFVRSMNNCHLLFGEYAFRRWPKEESRRCPINRALFDSWGTALVDYDSDSVKAAKCDIVDRAREIMTNDADFIESISRSTGDVKNVRMRFDKVRTIVREVLS